MKTRESFPKCYKCGSRVETREDQAIVRFEGEEILFQRVPMGVCTGCGGRFLTSQTARLMEHATVLCSSIGHPGPGHVRALREALRLSRDVFAAKIGVSGQTVFRWETGKSKPSRWALSRIEALRKRAGKRKGRRAG